MATKRLSLPAALFLLLYVHQRNGVCRRKASLGLTRILISFAIQLSGVRKASWDEELSSETLYRSPTGSCGPGRVASSSDVLEEELCVCEP